MKITIFERITMPFELFEQKYDDMTSSFTPPPPDIRKGTLTMLLICISYIV